VVNAIAGAAGLTASILALRAGRNLALANKESIVMGYRLLKNSQMHNIVTSSLSILSMQHFSLVHHFRKPSIAELIITASGGPSANCHLRPLPT